MLALRSAGKSPRLPLVIANSRLVAGMAHPALCCQHSSDLSPWALMESSGIHVREMCVALRSGTIYRDIRYMLSYTVACHGTTVSVSGRVIEQVVS